jgi:hypothetical protein
MILRHRTREGVMRKVMHIAAGFALGVAFIVFTSAPSFAQASGKIVCRVLDSTGAGVPGVVVQAVPKSKWPGTFSALTGADGAAILPECPSGVYDIRVQGAKERYRKIERIFVPAERTTEVVMKPEAGEKKALRAAATVQKIFIDLPTTAYIAESREMLPVGPSLFETLWAAAPFIVFDRSDYQSFSDWKTPAFTSHAFSARENGFLLNGMDFTDPVIPGEAMFYPVEGLFHYGTYFVPPVSFEPHRDIEVLVPTSPILLYESIPLEAGFSGTVTELSAGPAGKTGLRAALSFAELAAAKNVEPASGTELRARREPYHGYFPGGVVEVERPLKKDKILFQASASRFGFVRRPEGFPVDVDSEIITGSAGLLVRRLLSNDTLNLLLARQAIERSYAGAGKGILPQATSQEDEDAWHAQARYRRDLAGDLSFHAAIAYTRRTLGSDFQNDVAGPSVLDIVTGERRDAPAFLESFERGKLVFQAGILKHLSGVTAGGQDLTARLDWKRGTGDDEKRALGDMGLVEENGRPLFVTFYRSPSVSSVRTQDVGLTLNDRINFGGKGAALDLGLRLDRSTVDLLAQTAPAGRFFPETSFGGREGVISWTTLSPAANFRIDLDDTGKWAAGLHYGRYHFPAAGFLADFVNPASWGGELYRWDDQNGNGKFEAGEQGDLLKAFGGWRGETAEDLKRPYTDDFSVSIRRDFMKEWSLQVSGYHRRLRNGIALFNTGVPFSSFGERMLLDVGSDGIAGTSDDAWIPVYEQDPATLGDDRYRLGNSADLNSYSQGVEFAVAAKPVQRLSLRFSFSVFRMVGERTLYDFPSPDAMDIAGLPVENPNTLTNSGGRLPFDRAITGKILFELEAPHGFFISGIAKYWDGEPFARLVLVDDVPQGVVVVRATKVGRHRFTYSATLDLHAEKALVCKGVPLYLFFDAFNLLSPDLETSETVFSGPDFRRPATVLQPATFRFGARVQF